MRCMGATSAGVERILASAWRQPYYVRVINFRIIIIIIFSYYVDCRMLVS